MHAIVLRIAFLLPLVLLASCIPGYGPKGWNGIGYDDAALDANTIRVSYFGGSAHDVETVERYAFYRCAEVTAERGFDYFVVIDGSTANLTKSDISTNVENRVSGGTGHGEVGGSKGTTSTTTATTKVTSKTSHTVLKTIKLFKGTKPADNYSAYNAREVLSTLGPNIKK